MLLIGIPLTGVGSLEKQSNGIWCLVPHKKWGGILTRTSRAEIMSQYRHRSLTVRVLSVCFSIIALGTATYLVYKSYFKHQRQSSRLPTILSTNNANEIDHNSDTRFRCIICLNDETIIYSIQPCSHIGLCHSCVSTLQSGNRREELCPLCRTPIEGYQRVFLP